MPDEQAHHDVVVVGAGVSGCASARALATDHDVLLLDKGQPAGEASGLAAGNCAPTLFYADVPAVARHANQFFREFDGTGQFSFHERPRVELINPAKVERARERAERIASNGFPVSFLHVEEARENYPEFDFSEFAGVVEYRDTGWLDPYTYTISLKEDAERRGATFRTGVEVTDLAVRQNRVTGVETTEGTINAETVVVATGWRIHESLAEYVSIPVRPFKLQCAIIRGEEELRRDFPTGRVSSKEVYFRGEPNGDLLVGGGEYFIDTESAGSLSTGAQIDEAFRMEVALTVPEFMEGFGDAELVNAWAGVDSATPDAMPILDAPADGPDNLVVSTGFNGLGMLNSGVAAGAV